MNKKTYCSFPSPTPPSLPSIIDLPSPVLSQGSQADSFSSYYTPGINHSKYIVLYPISQADSFSIYYTPGTNHSKYIVLSPSSQADSFSSYYTPGTNEKRFQKIISFENS